MTIAAKTTDDFHEMDNSKVTAFHWKVMFISGMGFFTDAYDLFIIGVAMALIKDEWHPSALQVSLVTSTALFASMLGALIFGRVADVLGRKKIYGLEVLVLSAGAVACAFSPGITWLIVFRFILGLGIGGDYPVSATIMSEYSGKCTRGMMVAMVFAMQAAGLILGPLVAVALLWSGIKHDFAWRIMLALGAVPAMSVYLMRRQIGETPRFKKLSEAKKSNNAGQKDNSSGMFTGVGQLVSNRRLFLWLIGCSLAWFLMDFAYYGNTVSSPLVLQAIQPNKTLLSDTLLQLLIFVVAAAPGYFVAARLMDRIGRKPIQVMGFAVMAAAFAVIALWRGLDHMVWPFVGVFGISYFFTEFGPNATTFIYPSELFPVDLRTTGHGIASAAGKLGAFVGVFLFPLLMKSHGLFGAELAAAAVSVAGLVVTLFMLPETKGKSLESLSGEQPADPKEEESPCAR